MYKKLFLIAAVVLFILFEFMGNENRLGDVDSNAAMIKPAELTNNEKILLHAGGAETVFAFDFYLPKQNYKYIDVWVDYHKNGKKQGKKIGSSTLINKTKDGRLIFAILSPTSKYERAATWMTTVISDNGYSQGGYITLAQPKEGNTMTSPLHGTQTIKAGVPITLAVIIKDPDATTFTIDPAIYENKESALKKLSSRYQYVYILKCKFRKTATGGL